MTAKVKLNVAPVGLYSRAMTRIADALIAGAPPTVEITSRRHSADVHVYYVIGSDILPHAVKLRAEGRHYIAVQCCYKGVGGTLAEWQEFWQGALFTMSYYDLSALISDPSKFLHCPLGVDMHFRVDLPQLPRTITALTSGYVSSPCAEAISEVWTALDELRKRGAHLGPTDVVGIPLTARRPSSFSFHHGIDDTDLATLYSRTHYVAALRHVEGFELPAAEGLLCGARAILFDQPDLRTWYRNSAIYVPECHGRELVDRLKVIFSTPPHRVSALERQWLLDRFDWSTIISRFYSRLAQSLTDAGGTNAAGIEVVTP